MPTPTKKIHVYALLLPDSLLLDMVGPVEEKINRTAIRN
jgi:hypothetical protein